MKLSAALALVAFAASGPSSAAGQLRRLANDPKTIENKAGLVEEYHDSPFGEVVLRHLLNDNNSHFPECINRKVFGCIDTLKNICNSNPSRFPGIETVGGCDTLHAEVHYERDRTSAEYNYVVVVPNETGTYAVGGRKDCLQHYWMPWVVNGDKTDIGPWDCSDGAGGCLSVEACCNVITSSGTPVDDRGSALQCKAQPLSRAYEEADPNRIFMIASKNTGRISAAARINY